MATSLITSQFQSNTAVSFIQRVASRNNTFIAISNTTQSAVVDTAVDSSSDIQEVTDTLIGGVKITEQDLAVSTKRYDWVSGNVYDRYNAFQRTECVVSVYDGSKIRVYKCLNNNNGSKSTVQPSGTLSKPFTTSDYYIWKFLWEVSTSNLRFATSTTIPVISSANTIAPHLTVDTLTIDDSGRGYNNYFDGIVQTNDLDTLLTLRLPAQASAIGQFYNKCLIEITNPGSASYGEVRSITDYNGITKTITFDSKFTNLQVNDTYSIRPQVFVTGSSNTAVVSAVINSNANTISRVIVHSPGSDYSNPVANVYAHSSVGVQRAGSITPHVSPIKGHGGDLLNEVRANQIVIQKTIANTVLFTQGIQSFSQVSILSNPLFANVVVTGSAGRTSSFVPGEQVIGYRQIGRSIGTATTSLTNMVGSNTQFTSTLSANDKIIVSNTTNYGFATVVSVANDTNATITSDYPITGDVSLVSAVNFGNVQFVNSTALVLTNVPAGVQNNIKQIAGKTSHVFDNAQTITYPQSEQVISGVKAVNGPTVVKNSGNVMYIKNNLPINILANKTISVKLSISF